MIWPWRGICLLDCTRKAMGLGKCRARSIQPKFPEISAQNSMDRFGPTGKVSKTRVHLLRWTTFPGRTGWNFGWMDAPAIYQPTIYKLNIFTIDRNQSQERTSIMLYPVMKILQLYFGYFEYILQSMFKWKTAVNWSLTSISTCGDGRNWQFIV